MSLVEEDLVFVDSAGDTWTAPIGTLTDGASVPRAALPITDGRFDQRFLKAAVVHDAYCQEDNEGRFPYRTKPWRAVHRMFHEGCLAGGTPKLTAKLMYNAVRWFGPRWDEPERALERIAAVDRLSGFAATRHWIEETDPPLEIIERDVESREETIMAVTRLQNTGISALDTDPATADRAFNQAELLVEKGLERAPEDLMYLNLKGYNAKNRAMLDPAHADKQLAAAEQAFHSVLAHAPQDPSALNGLGSVAILRGELERAEGLIRRALAIEPDYPAARHDLELVRRERARRS